MIFAPAIPFLIALKIGFKAFLRANKTKDIVKHSDDVIDAVKLYQQNAQETIQSDLDADLQSVKDFVASDLPAFTKEFSVSIDKPRTMPDYLSNQNELASAQIEKTNQVTDQLKFQNELTAKSIAVQEKANANMRLIAETLSASLPAVVVQLQEVSKIASVISLSSEIDTAYKEQALDNHATLIKTIKALELSVTNEAIEQTINVVPSAVAITNDVATPTINVTNDIAVPKVDVNVVPSEVSITNQIATPSVSVTNEAPVINVASQEKALENLTTATTQQTQELAKVSTNLNAVSSNAVKQEELATYQTTIARITDLDGNVVAELKPHELSTYKDVALIKAKEKENELATYQTTIARITDLDGNVVAELKPHELSTYKDVALVKAKEKEKEIADYNTTEQVIKDIDGSTIATAKPMNFTTMKDATLTNVQSKQPSILKSNADKMVQAIDNHSTKQVSSAELSNEHIAGLSNTLITSSNSRAEALNAQTQELKKVATNLTAVSDNAKSQKVIADYAQTETSIKNLDGNVVATAKPMEITAIKNAVNAKNETDEMEFELDDDIINEFFPDTIPLPTYTKTNIFEDNKKMYDNYPTNK